MVTSSLHTTDTEVEFADDIQLVSTTDLKGDITYANPAFCQVAGYRLEEMLGQHHNLVHHPTCPRQRLPISGPTCRRANHGEAW